MIYTILVSICSFLNLVGAESGLGNPCLGFISVSKSKIDLVSKMKYGSGDTSNRLEMENKSKHSERELSVSITD